MKRDTLILLGFVLAGAVVGLVQMIMADQPKWQRISSPPPVLVKLGNEDILGIHATDANGRWYNCPGGGTCTELAAGDQPTQTVECPLGNVRPTPVPPLPVVSQRVYYLCSLYPVREDTIITSDGSIWQSAQNNGTNTPLFDIIYRVVYVAFWIAVSLLVYAVYRFAVKLRRLTTAATTKGPGG
ncbi:MAG TPA: hypothetical protein VGK87_13650 [Anaerolineae bacterium]|jgi:hypothetical protein